jgi:hypothetical protein
MRRQALTFTASVAVLTALLAGAASVAPAAQKAQKAQKKKERVEAPTGAEQLIQGGTFEASGVIQVAGTDGVLFVDDGRDDVVFWMRVDRESRQLEPAVPIPLGVRVGDLEGITTDGTFYYVVGSQSKPEFAGGAGLVRFRFDPASRTIKEVESVSGLRGWLTSRLPSIASAAGSRPDGFNIEGLAWDQKAKRLLMGLRSPVVDGQAIVVPIDLGAGPLAGDRMKTGEADLIRLPLDNSGIRSMEYDSGRGAFRIIAASRGSSPFRLWNWAGGTGTAAQVRSDASFAAKLKPEGVTPVAGQPDFTLIVFDTSRYLAVQ